MNEEGSNSCPLEQDVEAISTTPVEDRVDITVDTQASLDTSNTDVEKESEKMDVRTTGVEKMGVSTTDVGKEGAKMDVTNIPDPNVSSTQNLSEMNAENCDGPTSVKRKKLEPSADQGADMSSDTGTVTDLTQEVVVPGFDRADKTVDSEQPKSTDRVDVGAENAGDTEQQPSTGRVDVGSENTGASELPQSPDRVDVGTVNTGDLENPPSTDSVKVDSEGTGEMQAAGDTEQDRGARKRKLPDDTAADTAFPLGNSTYDRVRLVIQPWRKPEGGINKPIFKMMLESVMLHFMMRPGSGERSLNDRYKPYLQPMVLKNIVNILIDLGCLTCHSVIKPKVSLFSEFHVEETDVLEGDDVSVFYLPSEDCLFRLGHFGKAFFPNAKWPESTVAT